MRSPAAMRKDASSSSTRAPTRSCTPWAEITVRIPSNEARERWTRAQTPLSLLPASVADVEGAAPTARPPSSSLGATMTDPREQPHPTPSATLPVTASVEIPPDDATPPPPPAVRGSVATDIALVGTFAAFLAVCAILPPIPTGTGVDITLQTFGVMLAGLVLGPRRGALAALLYVLVGAAGL